jgi:uncharacterized protein (DUF1501 family)
VLTKGKTMDSFHCGTAAHFSRRNLLGVAAGLGLANWLTPVAESLARAAGKLPSGAPARSLIVLWMQGGPSQLETFDPHPGGAVSGGPAIKTRAKGISIGKGLEQVAEQMEHVSIIRSVTSKEGDHERASYNVKTGYRPDQTLVHPSLGSIVCHQLKDNLEIPRHVSILPGQWPSRGGYLGDGFDAFKIGDPNQPLPDVSTQVSTARYQRRLDDLEQIAEKEFARGRIKNLDESKTLHLQSIRSAYRMMSSDQLKAFNVSEAPISQRQAYGDSSFGRGCLAALRLVKAGVRCVEVTLDGWDSHINNDEFCAARLKDLDPAYAALLRDLKAEGLLDSTLVLWAGEFGRTPRINPAGGRDHWPHGFSITLAGGGVPGGRVIGETSPTPSIEPANVTKDVKTPIPVEDVHATVLKLLGIEHDLEVQTPIGRPMKLSEGKVIKDLLA